jgi:hypothetical protein
MNSREKRSLTSLVSSSSPPSSREAEKALSRCTCLEKSSRSIQHCSGPTSSRSTSSSLSFPRLFFSKSKLVAMEEQSSSSSSQSNSLTHPLSSSLSLPLAQSLISSRLSTSPTLLPPHLAQLVTALSLCARVSVRASALFIEAVLEGLQYTTVTGLGVTRRALIAAVGSARAMQYVKEGLDWSGRDERGEKSRFVHHFELFSTCEGVLKAGDDAGIRSCKSLTSGRTSGPISSVLLFFFLLLSPFLKLLPLIDPPHLHPRRALHHVLLLPHPQHPSNRFLCR